MKFNFDFLYRKKYLDQNIIENTQLSRVLNTFDIVALGSSHLFFKLKLFNWSFIQLLEEKDFEIYKT